MPQISINMDEIYVEAHNLAGRHIQQMIGENKSNFTWIRPQITRPSFDDLNFRYKNQVFSILIKIFRNGKEMLDPRREETFIRETKANNLIPCVFPIEFEFVPTASAHGFGILIKPGETPSHELKLQDSTGWNLFHVATNERINPLDMADDTPVLMSNYEMQNFAIQIVRDHLQKDGLKLESFCDAPGITPQVWFQDKNGKMCWVCVAYGSNAKNVKTPDISKFLNGALADYDGYFAPVGIQPIEGDKPYRGIGYYVDYSGLISIHKKN